jgi:hypothetical protein
MFLGDRDLRQTREEPGGKLSNKRVNSDCQKLCRFATLVAGLAVLPVGFAVLRSLAGDSRSSAAGDAEYRSVSGYVVGGSDTTPSDLMDAPRRFVYLIRQGDGTITQVSYTAFPPSPAGDRQRAKIRLVLHAGKIQAGDFLRARGRYNATQGVVEVKESGDYLETYPMAP